MLRLERRHTIRHSLTYRHSSCDEDTNSGNEGNLRRRSRCPGAAGYLSGSNTGEPAKLDWMRTMRLAKFLVAHSELEWLYQAQDVPEKVVVYGDSDWAGFGHAKEHDRSIRTAWTASH